MVDVTIDDLPDGGAGLGPDEFEIWRVGTSLRLDLASIAQYANGLLTAGAPTGLDTFAEVASALSGKQPLDATLTALAGVTFAADKGLYSTGPDAFATFDLTAGGRALGGVAGTSGTFPYFSASNVVTLGTITAAGRALIDDADAADQRTTLGLGTVATQAASAVAFTGGTAVGLSYLQVTGSTPPGLSGSGLELIGGGSATFQAYNRTGGAYINMHMDGLEILLRPSGSERGRFGTYGLRATGSLRPSSYTVGTLPSASTHGAGALIYVSDESGGAIPAFSDATNWRRVSDRAIVS